MSCIATTAGCRLVVVVFGGHASGKTTWARAFVQDNPGFTLYSDGHKDLSGTKAEKAENLRRILEGLEGHAIFEGARLPDGLLDCFVRWAPVLGYKLVIVVPVMSGSRMQSNLKHRKTVCGKGWTPKDEVTWSLRACEQAGGLRQLRAVQRVLSAAPPGSGAWTSLVTFRLSDGQLDFSAWAAASKGVLRELSRLCGPREP